MPKPLEKQRNVFNHVKSVLVRVVPVYTIINRTGLVLEAVLRPTVILEELLAVDIHQLVDGVALHPPRRRDAVGHHAARQPRAPPVEALVQKEGGVRALVTSNEPRVSLAES